MIETFGYISSDTFLTEISKLLDNPIWTSVIIPAILAFFSFKNRKLTQFERYHIKGNHISYIYFLMYIVVLSLFSFLVLYFVNNGQTLEDKITLYTPLHLMAILYSYFFFNFNLKYPGRYYHKENGKKYYYHHYDEKNGIAYLEEEIEGQDNILHIKPIEECNHYEKYFKKDFTQLQFYYLNQFEKEITLKTHKEYKYTSIFGLITAILTLLMDIGVTILTTYAGILNIIYLPIIVFTIMMAWSMFRISHRNILFLTGKMDEKTYLEKISKKENNIDELTPEKKLDDIAQTLNETPPGKSTTITTEGRTTIVIHGHSIDNE